MKKTKKETVSKADLFEVLNKMESLQITYWLDGGWGVDALGGKQTREHRDIDLDFDSRYTDKLLSALGAAGYVIETDQRPVRIELHHPDFGYLDIHPFVLCREGTARQADLEGGWYEFESDFFGTAEFGGRRIPCISLKGQLVFHSGYEPRPTDLHDLEILHRLEEEGRGKNRHMG